METAERFREKCRATIAEAFESDNPVLVEALPALGKTTGVVRWAAETGNQITVYAQRHDLYEAIGEKAEEEGLSWAVLPSFYYHCPTGGKNKDHGEEWQERFKRAYNAGHSAKYLHENDERIFGERLPCQHEGECPFMTEREREYDDVDVLVGYYTNLFEPDTNADRYVVIDEFPDDAVLTRFNSDQTRESVNAYLAATPELPFETIDSAQEYRRDIEKGYTPEHKQAVDEWRSGWDGKTYESVKRQINERQPVHLSFGPLLLRGELTAKKIDEGVRRKVLKDGTILVRTPDGHSTILPPTRRTKAEKSTSTKTSKKGNEEKKPPKGFIGLDGTPSVELWKVILGAEMEHHEVLTFEEKRGWLNHLGLCLIQLTDDLEACLGGNRNRPHEDYALIQQIARMEKQSPFVVGSKKDIKQWTNHGYEFDPAPANYGALKGRNDLADEPLALIIGSPHQNDKVIQKWAALRGKQAKRAKDKKGRPLTGRDLTFGKVGDDILHGTRENEVLQAAMRFTRNPGDPETRVYVYTSALPEWVPRNQPTVSEYMWYKDKGLKQVIEAFEAPEDWERTEQTTVEIADRVKKLYGEEAIKTDQVRKLLKRLKKELRLIDGEKRGRELIWWNRALEQRATNGQVIIRDA